MVMDILLGTMSVLGMAGGISALVLYHKQNGNGHKPEPNPWRFDPPLPPPAPPPVEVQWPPELAALLTHVTERLEDGLSRLENPPVLVEPEPTWPADLQAGIENLAARMEGLESMREAKLEQLIKGMETEAPAEPPQIQIPPEFTRRLDNLMAYISRLLQPMMRTEPPEPVFTPRGPATRAPIPVQLDLFNTVILQDNELVELRPPEQHLYVLSVFNLGAGTCYMKARDDLFIDDPLATTIPAGSGDNGVHCPVSLFVIAEDGCKLSIRLNQ